jgi:hypothetical protein
MRKLVLLLLMCALPAVAVAASAPPKAAAKPVQSDAALEQTIKARFAKSKISADHFTVHVQGGVATVEGKTDVIQHKGTATRIVHACGAQIVNKIQISEAAREKAAANLAKHRGGDGKLKKSAVALR